MRLWILLAAFAVALLPSPLSAASDSITVGTVTADTTTVDVPIYVRDVSGTPLGVDQPSGSRIQAIAFKIVFDPAKVAGTRLQYSDIQGGVLNGLNPLFSSVPRTQDSVSFLASYNEQGAPIPFTSDAPAPGNLVVIVTVLLKAGLTVGDHVTLTLDPVATSLSNQAGSVSESKAAGTLDVVSGEIVIAAPRSPRRIIPAAASTPGLNGAFFRTMVQIANPSATAVIGRVIFHPAGAAASSTDPAINLLVYAHQTVEYDDLVPAIGASGVGTVDVVADTGPLPSVLARIYNDAGAGGTTGMYEETFTDDQALVAGDQGILSAPPDPVSSRMNIGFRTLDRDAKMTITLRNKNGAVVKTFNKTIYKNLFVQTSAQDLLGVDVGPSDMIVFALLDGSAIIYGSTVDNTTQDPSWQTAWKVPSATAKGMFSE